MDENDNRVFAKVDGLIVEAGTEADMVNEMNARGIEEFDIVEDLCDGDQISLPGGTTLSVFKNELHGTFFAQAFEGEIFAPEDLGVLSRVGVSLIVAHEDSVEED